MSVNLSNEFIDDVVTMLSGTLVDVELDTPDIETAYRMAKKTWKQKGSDNLNHSFYQLDVVSGQNEYQLPAEIADVVSVITMSNDAFTMEDPFAMASFQETFTYGMGGGVSADFFYIYDMTRQIIDNNKMYTAEEPNFRFNRRSNTIYLFNPPSVDRKWVLEVYRQSTDEEYQNNLWILNWTIAECKQILGRAYRKFGSLPSPTGESQLDGDTLVQEAQREKELLLEEIDNFVDGDPDGMGVYIG